MKSSIVRALLEGVVGVVSLMGGVVAVADFFGIREEVSKVAAAHIDWFVIGTALYIVIRWIFVDVANYNRQKTFSNRRRAKTGAGAKSGSRK